MSATTATQLTADLRRRLASGEPSPATRLVETQLAILVGSGLRGGGACVVAEARPGEELTGVVHPPWIGDGGGEAGELEAPADEPILVR